MSKSGSESHPQAESKLSERWVRNNRLVFVDITVDSGEHVTR